ncbi:MAG: RdgB/HAM1 family non-canonical purine NTP pyrophosphatase [Clostridia bacterium]|nr:RdgB/HAM1 family non-canonical purine NTP pyrophosphatase [Clostridia bacterium]
MDIIICTHNAGKRTELARILSPLGINVLLPHEAGFILNEVEETGNTFAENARLKAFSGVMDTGMPCVADDSGLCVSALGGRPGLYTARYGGEELPYPEKIKLLVKELDGASDRSAYFISSVCCAFPDGVTVTAEGRCDGEIGFEPQGENGFGFDPIFFHGGRAFATLTAEEKDAVSHRGNALRALAQKLRDALNPEN